MLGHRSYPHGSRVPVSSEMSRQSHPCKVDYNAHERMLPPNPASCRQVLPTHVYPPSAVRTIVEAQHCVSTFNMSKLSTNMLSLSLRISNPHPSYIIHSISSHVSRWQCIKTLVFMPNFQYPLRFQLGICICLGHIHRLKPRLVLRNPVTRTPMRL